jgi:sugar phosphate isomerase/epimerase
MITEEEQGMRPQLLDNMKNALIEAVAYGKKQGITVSMEDFDGLDAPYCTIEGLQWFMTQVEGLQCSFDTGNFLMHHEDELEAFELFADKICAVHLKDRSLTQGSSDDIPCICADGQKRYPTPVGSGYIHMKEILEGLKARNYQGTLIVELFNYGDMLEGLRQSLKWIRDNI